MVALALVGLALAACSVRRPASADSRPAIPGLTTPPSNTVHASPAQPIVIGETFSINSSVMGEVRHINVLIPTIYGQKISAPMPVLYMLDGGLDEDFLHVAGLVQVLVSNGGMRPFMLVGIPNTARRRDMTGPTANAEDLKIAPVVGGSATFRRFIKEELMPAVAARYSTTQEAAIVGESLAGLFVVETLLQEPDLFTTYIAFDPSLWWADQDLLKSADARLSAAPVRPRSIFVASSNDPETLSLTSQFAAIVETRRIAGITIHYAPFLTETHATIYHPAALLAFRTMFAPTSPAK
jgi:predicted alpha/beta superfamily hydrolase